jgi:stage V sporulation protein G
MKVTEVRVYPADHEELRGFASITLDNCWMIRELKIIQSKSGRLYVAMPSKKQQDGTYWDIAYPITAEARVTIEQAILTTYRAIYEQQKAPRGKL